jgi:hypothetical protein
VRSPYEGSPEDSEDGLVFSDRLCISVEHMKHLYSVLLDLGDSGSKGCSYSTLLLAVNSKEGTTS